MPSPHGYTNYARRAPADMSPEQRVALELGRARGDDYAPGPDVSGEGPGPDGSALHEDAEAPAYERQEGDELQDGMPEEETGAMSQDDQLAMIIAEIMRRRQLQGTSGAPMRGGV